MPYEIAHDPSHDTAANQLEESHGMKHELRVVGRRGFRAAIERVEHDVWFFRWCVCGRILGSAVVLDKGPVEIREKGR